MGKAPSALVATYPIPPNRDVHRRDFKWPVNVESGPSLGKLEFPLRVRFRPFDEPIRRGTKCHSPGLLAAVPGLGQTSATTNRPPRRVDPLSNTPPTPIPGGLPTRFPHVKADRRPVERTLMNRRRRLHGAPRAGARLTCGLSPKRPPKAPTRARPASVGAFLEPMAQLQAFIGRHRYTLSQ